MKLPSYAMRAIALASCFSLAGCNTMGLVNFQPAPHSGKPAGEIQILLLDVIDSSRGSAKSPLTEAASSAYEQHCRPAAQTQAEGVAAAIFLPVIGELFVGLVADWAERRADALKEASEASYAGRVNLNSSHLAGLIEKRGCIAIVRYDPPSAEQAASGGTQSKVAGLTAILKLGPATPGRKDAFVFQPVYVSASNSTAITRKNDAPAVAVGLALSIASIGKQENGLPGYFLVGQGGSAAPKVLLNASESRCSKSACATSEPIPIPLDPNGLVSLGIGVTEKGSLGFDVDVAKAQISAIKAAVGPAIGEIIKKKASPDSE